MQILEVLQHTPVIPVVVLENSDDAVPLAKALLQGNISVMEITLRTPAALESIRQVAEFVPEICVGAGSVISTQQMQAVKAAGAQFAISPGWNPELMQEAQKEGLPYLPGVGTISEAMQAYVSGVTVVKFFPAELMGGVEAINAYSQVLPGLKFCPTGGIDLSKAAQYLALKSVVAVGGSWLTPTHYIMQHNWAGITAICHEASLLRSSAGVPPESCFEE